MMTTITDRDTILADMLTVGMRAEEAVGLVYGDGKRWHGEFIKLVYKMGRGRAIRRFRKRSPEG